MFLRKNPELSSDKCKTKSLESQRADSTKQSVATKQHKPTHYNPLISFHWNEKLSSSDMSLTTAFFVNAFVGAYDDKAVVSKKFNLKNDDTFEKYLQRELNAEFKIIGEQKNNVRIQYLLARYNDMPVGLITCELNQRSGRVYIRWLAVSPKAQGMGIAKKMLENVLKHYPESIGVELYAKTYNYKSVEFYQKHCAMTPVKNFDFSKVVDGKAISKQAVKWFTDTTTLYLPDDESFGADESNSNNDWLGFYKHR